MRNEAHSNQPRSSLSGVRKGNVVAVMLLLGIGLILGKRYLEGEAVWEQWQKKQALLHPELEKPKKSATASRRADRQHQRHQTASPHLRDPERALWHFFDRLASLENSETSDLVRILYYGTSEIGFDRVTSQMRRMLQARFGDGGKGLVVAAPGWRYQRHRDVVWRVGEGWQVYTVRAGRRDDGMYGLGGVLAVNDAPTWIQYGTVSAADQDDEGYHPFTSGKSFSHFELHYQAFPGGGSFLLQIDDTLKKTISTAHDEVQDRVFETDVEAGPHQVRIETGVDPVRLYGAVFEQNRGLVLDAAMIVGAWAHTHHNYDPEHLAAQVKEREPDLIIFQLGAKEVFRKPHLTDEEATQFVQDLEETIELTMRARPRASCLVVSAKEIGMQVRNRIVTTPAVFKVVDGARRAAKETGCAFFDLFAAMGGPGTMEQWSHHDPRLVSPDLGHLMDPGAIRVGTILGETLLDEYELYLSERDKRGTSSALAGPPADAGP